MMTPVGLVLHAPFASATLAIFSLELRGLEFALHAVSVATARVPLWVIWDRPWLDKYAAEVAYYQQGCHRCEYAHFQ